MALEDRRARDRAARHRLILDTARTLAESEGWDAVTTRRLAAEIEYSQPVIYKHFAGMEAIAEALAVDGFGELAEVLRAARTGAGENPLIPTAHAYLSFAGDNPALYDAMFLRATGLRFASEDTPARSRQRSPSCGTLSPQCQAKRRPTPVPRCSGPHCTASSPSAAAGGSGQTSPRRASNCWLHSLDRRPRA